MYNYRPRASALRPKTIDAPLTQRYLRINSLCVIDLQLSQGVKTSNDSYLNDIALKG